ncbi:MAG: hypothetical protein JWN96_1633, partial [Mycobacterium sp.]|nr:hypothetical protein [Mycobacterium sp.]
MTAPAPEVAAAPDAAPPSGFVSRLTRLRPGPRPVSYRRHQFPQIVIFL